MAKEFSPWAWLKGFGYFLLCWPILCLLGLEDFRKDEDWQSILFLVFGPALLGLVLILIELVMTRWYGDRVYKMSIPVPNILRDISNCFWCLLIFLLVIFAAYLLSEGPAFAAYLLDGGYLEFLSIVKVILLFTGLALVFFFLSRLFYGKSHTTTLGAQWKERVFFPRLLGYLGMMPLLILIPVFLVDFLPGEHTFEIYEQLLLLFFLWLFLRGIMAYPAGAWAKHPWEYEMRRLSLHLPWYLTTIILFWGSGAFLVTISFLKWDDGSIESLSGKILLALLMTLSGGFCFYIGSHFAKLFYQQSISTLRCMQSLQKNPDSLASWRVTRTMVKGKYSQETNMATVHITLKNGNTWNRSYEESVYPLAQFLRAQYPALETKS